MALTTSTISGRVVLPNDQTPKAAELVFRLLQPGSEGADIAMGAVRSVVVDGVMTAVQLWSEARYHLVARWVESDRSNGAREVTHDFGRIFVGDASAYSLPDLLPIQIPAGTSNTATFKRGDTINIGGQWLDDNRRPLDLTGLTLTCAMLGPDGVTRPLPLTVSDAPAGLIEIALAASASAALPLGRHRIDVKITNGARVARTQTGFINIIEEITP